MIQPGRLCIKLRGRDKGRYCVIVEKLDKNYVLIDGAVRRRKCNINHLKLLPEVLDVKLDKESIRKELVKRGYIKEKKRNYTPRPRAKK